jgi:hypothetical protein
MYPVRCSILASYWEVWPVTCLRLLRDTQRSTHFRSFSMHCVFARQTRRFTIQYLQSYSIARFYLDIASHVPYSLSWSPRRLPFPPFLGFCVCLWGLGLACCFRSKLTDPKVRICEQKQGLRSQPCYLFGTREFLVTSPHIIT